MIGFPSKKRKIEAAYWREDEARRRFPVGSIIIYAGRNHFVKGHYWGVDPKGPLDVDQGRMEIAAVGSPWLVKTVALQDVA